jgi:hypothetical protein
MYHLEMRCLIAETERVGRVQVQVLMPPTQLYKLINNLNKMKRTTPATHYTAAAPRSVIFGEAA